ncbi:MAG: type I glyceraldehyde-3-phosphate dehydrogenase [Flavobacteriaceae bacterium]|nr:type I glyceraldehyde-3-phosphate dehydrogenase [Flavobacteriaceae bacterium]
MEPLKIGINGFGRIGRTLFRLLEKEPSIEVVAINDPAETPTLAHLLKYDSIHGPFPSTVSHDDNTITAAGHQFAVLHETNPAAINWGAHGVRLVVECSGKFKTADELQAHLLSGPEKVILSAPPADDDIPMTVFGVNESELKADDHIISAASCTTNNAAPMLKVMDELCGIEQAYITTIHSYTSDQSLHDQPHRDLRRARAAGQSIVPTTTGAAKALTRVFPHLAPVIGGCGIRVPVPNGSLTDITLNVKKSTSIAAVNRAFREASENSLKNILFYTEDPIVSIDINNSYHSCTFDSQMTSVIGKMVKIIGWYDNETGYSSRLIDVVKYLMQKNYI